MKEKILKIRFDNSREDIKLYNWIITHEDMEEFVKQILIKEMNDDLEYVSVSKKDLKEMKEEIKKAFGDKFKDEDKQKKTTFTESELNEISTKAKERFK